MEENFQQEGEQLQEEAPQVKEDELVKYDKINKSYVLMIALVLVGLILFAVFYVLQKDPQIAINPYSGGGDKTDPLYDPDKTVAGDKNPANDELIDDWELNIDNGLEESIGFGAVTKNMAMPNAVTDSASFGLQTESIGLAVGGAKDVNNFRENINNNYTPLPTDITYEGLYYDYFFDTGQTQECNKLFCPSYQYAISPDPISGEDDYYLSVGLNSNLKESDFERKSLNLVIVLDISGSMGSSFNEYYYDRFGNRIKNDYYEEERGKSKMEVANEAVVSLLKHLNPDDRFGVVLFNSGSYLAKPMNRVGDTDMDKIKDHILEIRQGGGTNMEAGISEGTELYSEYLEVDKDKYENRVIFLTDAMPNRGVTDENGLLGLTKSNAENGLYTSFIGIGVDFNTELVESITKIKGANYYSVHSGHDFEQRMDDEFEFMVTPLVFDLKLTLDASGFEISKVYGSPEADEATGEIMKVNTLFPSKTQEGETRGGIVIMKLKKTSDDASLTLKTSYEDRSGRKGGDESQITILRDSEYYANNGIRKGIVLARYADLVKNWINDTRKFYQKPTPEPIDCWVNYERGLLPPEPRPMLGQWERQSVALEVNKHYGTMFGEFKGYFEAEMKVIGDEEMEQEVKIMNKLIKKSQDYQIVPYGEDEVKENETSIDDWQL